MSREEWGALLAGPLEGAVSRIEAAARDGVVEAMLALGQILLDGKAAPRDPAGAFAWFGAAAASGDTMGINMLGRCHELGWGTPRDPTRAAALYARAGTLDWALFNLGMLKLRGLGLPRDVAGARALFRQAAEQGHAKAMNMLGMLIEAEDPACAARYYRKAAEGGDFRGQFNLATVLAQAGDIQAALPWFRRALASGNPDILAAARRMVAAHPDAELRALASTACCAPRTPIGGQA